VARHPITRRGCHGYGWSDVRSVASGRKDRSAEVDVRSSHPARSRFSLHWSVRRGLLLAPRSEPFPVALPIGIEGGADCSVPRHLPLDGIQPAGRLFQGNGPGCSPSHGRSAPRKTVGTLRRAGRSVLDYPSESLPLGHPRFHRAHVAGSRFHGGFVPLHEEVRTRPRAAESRLSGRGGCGRTGDRHGSGSVGDEPARAAGGFFLPRRSTPGRSCSCRRR